MANKAQGKKNTGKTAKNNKKWWFIAAAAVVVIAVVLIVLLSAPKGPNQTDNPGKNPMDDIAFGMTKQEVENKLGKPDQAPESYNVYTYNDTEFSYQKSYFNIWFNDEDKVTHMTWGPCELEEQQGLWLIKRIQNMYTERYGAFVESDDSGEAVYAWDAGEGNQVWLRVISRTDIKEVQVWHHPKPAEE